MGDLLESLEIVRRFKGPRLANRVAQLERDAERKSVGDLETILDNNAITGDLLRAAIAVKRAAAQIDEVVHAVGVHAVYRCESQQSCLCARLWRNRWDG
jgi:hypothetical protein